MRTVFTFILSAVALFATAQNYKISCNVSTDFNGKPATLINKITGDTVSSTVIADGAFSFSGRLDKPSVLDVIVNKAKGVAATVIVGKDVFAETDLAVRPAKVVDGGYNEEFAAMRARVKAAPDAEAANGIYLKTIKKNRKNILGAYVLNTIVRQFTSYESLDKLMKKVKYASEFTSIGKMCTALYHRGQTAPGKQFVDFDGFTLDGSPTKLSDYAGKGKYVLVDFWASWCGPCKREIPNIIKINKEFAGKNLVLLGVGIGDLEEKFKAAVQELGVDYQQIFVPYTNDERTASVLYNVETIPHLMIIAPDGTILERGIQGSQLREKLAEYLK